MEVSSALLVAMMFVMLLSIAIGNLITALAVLVDRRTPIQPDAIHTSWLILILLQCLALFWSVVDILSIENWRFAGFLFTILGPILLLFATHVLVPDPGNPESKDLRRYYFGISRQFFLFFGLVQAWILAVQVILGDGLTTGSTVHFVLGGLVVVLLVTRASKVHSLGTAAVWLVTLAAFAARGAGFID